MEGFAIPIPTKAQQNYMNLFSKYDITIHKPQMNMVACLGDMNHAMTMCYQFFSLQHCHKTMYC